MKEFFDVDRGCSPEFFGEAIGPFVHSTEEIGINRRLLSGVTHECIDVCEDFGGDASSFRFGSHIAIFQKDHRLSIGVSVDKDEPVSTLASGAAGSVRQIDLTEDQVAAIPAGD